MKISQSISIYYLFFTFCSCYNFTWRTEGLLTDEQAEKEEDRYAQCIFSLAKNSDVIQHYRKNDVLAFWAPEPKIEVSGTQSVSSSYSPGSTTYIPGTTTLVGNSIITTPGTVVTTSGTYQPSGNYQLSESDQKTQEILKKKWINYNTWVLSHFARKLPSLDSKPVCHEVPGPVKNVIFTECSPPSSRKYIDCRKMGAKSIIECSQIAGTSIVFQYIFEASHILIAKDNDVFVEQRIYLSVSIVDLSKPARIIGSPARIIGSCDSDTSKISKPLGPMSIEEVEKLKWGF
jgi:hypothetical protein